MNAMLLSSANTQHRQADEPPQASTAIRALDEPVGRNRRCIAGALERTPPPLGRSPGLERGYED